MFVCKPQTALKERVGNVSFSAWKWTRVQLFLKVESCFIWEQIQARPWKRKWTNVSIIILRVNRLKISDIFFKNRLWSKRGDDVQTEQTKEFCETKRGLRWFHINVPALFHTWSSVVVFLSCSLPVQTAVHLYVKNFTGCLKGNFKYFSYFMLFVFQW